MPDSACASGWVRPALAGDLADGIVRDIVKWPDARLRNMCQPSGYLTGRDLRVLAADLLATMYAAGGRGLAAPQVGVLRRVFVMDVGWKDGRPNPLIVLDPEILWRSAEVATAPEQCLSIPDRPVDVARPVEITLAWYNLDGCHVHRRMYGAEARVAQHEADHLDGRLIVGD